MSKFYRKAPLLGAGKVPDMTDPAEIKAIGTLLISNNLEAKRRANLEAGLTDPKTFLTNKTTAVNKMKTSAVDKVFVEAYTQIQTLTGDYEEARKKAYKIAMAYQDLMLKEVDKVFPSSTNQRIVIDRPLK